MRCAPFVLFFASLVTTPASAQSSGEPTPADESIVEGDLRVPAIFRDVPRPRSDDLRVPDIFRDGPRPGVSDLRVPDVFRNEEGRSGTAELLGRSRPALSDLRIPDIFRNPGPVRLGIRLADPTMDPREPPADGPGLGRVLARP